MESINTIFLRSITDNNLDKFLEIIDSNYKYNIDLLTGLYESIECNNFDIFEIIFGRISMNDNVIYNIEKKIITKKRKDMFEYIIRENKSVGGFYAMPLSKWITKILLTYNYEIRDFYFVNIFVTSSVSQIRFLFENSEDSKHITTIIFIGCNTIEKLRYFLSIYHSIKPIKGTLASKMIEFNMTNDVKELLLANDKIDIYFSDMIMKCRNKNNIELFIFLLDMFPGLFFG